MHTLVHCPRIKARYSYCPSHSVRSLDSVVTCRPAMSCHSPAKPENMATKDSNIESLRSLFACLKVTCLVCRETCSCHPSASSHDAEEQLNQTYFDWIAAPIQCLLCRRMCSCEPATETITPVKVPEVMDTDNVSVFHVNISKCPS